MKKVISIIARIGIAIIMIFLIVSYYLNHISGENITFANVFTPGVNSDGSSKLYEDPAESFDENGFYIKIPKIQLFKAVVKDVDPRSKEVYVESWKYGVSHGKFTAYPNQIGNTYFFAHSVSDESKVKEEHAWFSKLTSVQMDDFVFVYYEGLEYKYQVISLKEVDPSATGIYTGVAPVQKITLQTCPNGSLNSRLIIDALLVETRDVSGLTRDEIYSYSDVNANQ
jgi:LPXTG-site transpeptidase (sortase) family protein